MSKIAFGVIDPAIKRTREILFPFDFKKWLKLLFLVILSGVASFGGEFQFF